MCFCLCVVNCVCVVVVVAEHSKRPPFRSQQKPHRHHTEWSDPHALFLHLRFVALIANISLKTHIYIHTLSLLLCCPLKTAKLLYKASHSHLANHQTRVAYLVFLRFSSLRRLSQHFTFCKCCVLLWLIELNRHQSNMLKKSSLICVVDIYYCW